MALGGAPGTDGEAPVLWRSEAGRPWEVVDAPEVAALSGSHRVGAVGAGPLGFVVASVREGPDTDRLVVLHSPDGRAWTRVDVEDPEGALLTVTAVAVGPAEAVVTGSAVTADASVHPRLWSGTPGGGWAPAVLPGDGDDALVGRLGAVAAAGDRFVALGQAGNPVPPGDYEQWPDESNRTVVVSGAGGSWRAASAAGLDPLGAVPASVGALVWDGRSLRLVAVDAGTVWVWSSPDGADWTEDAGPEDARPGGPDLHLAVAAGPGGVMVAVPGLNLARLWLSASHDGPWTELTSASPAFPRPGTVVEVDDVAAGGAGWVAVGSRNDRPDADSAVRYAAVWRSSDGRHWERTIDEVLDDALLTGVAGDAHGFVAVGAALDHGARVAAAWWSADGRYWQPVETHSPGQVSVIDAVVSTGTGFLAVGALRSGDATRATAWRSADGRTWTAQPIAEDALALDVCTRGDRALAVGSDLGTGEPMVWESVGGAWRPVEGLDRREGTTVTPKACAIGADGTDVVAVDISGDGQLYHRHGGQWAEPDAGTFLPFPHERTIDALVAGRTGFAALGGEPLGGQIDLAVWASRDGHRWDRAVPRDGPEQPGTQEAVAVDVAGDVAVVVANDGLGAAIWRAPAALFTR